MTSGKSDHAFFFAEKLYCCKWFSNRSVTMLFSNADGMKTVLRRQKELTLNMQVPCPDVFREQSVKIRIVNHQFFFTCAFFST